MPPYEKENVQSQNSIFQDRLTNGESSEGVSDKEKTVKLQHPENTATKVSKIPALRSGSRAEKPI